MARYHLSDAVHVDIETPDGRLVADLPAGDHDPAAASQADFVLAAAAELGKADRQDDVDVEQPADPAPVVQQIPEAALEPAPEQAEQAANPTEEVAS